MRMGRRMRQTSDHSSFELYPRQSAQEEIADDDTQRRLRDGAHVIARNLDEAGEWHGVGEVCTRPEAVVLLSHHDQRRCRDSGELFGAGSDRGLEDEAQSDRIPSIRTEESLGPPLRAPPFVSAEAVEDTAEELIALVHL